MSACHADTPELLIS